MDILQRGSRGDAVRLLQGMLERLNYYSGEIDGVFGAATAAAVRSFQFDHDLQADGIVGAQTWALLLTEDQTEQKWQGQGITLNERIAHLEKQVDALTARLAGIEHILKEGEAGNE